MSKCEGTPKTLRIAVGRSIRQGLASVDRNDDEALAIVRDYLAQKFGVAYAQASNDSPHEHGSILQDHYGGGVWINGLADFWYYRSHICIGSDCHPHPSRNLGSIQRLLSTSRVQSVHLHGDQILRLRTWQVFPKSVL